eukprot:890286-Rhodomonas_salina.1
MDSGSTLVALLAQFPDQGPHDVVVCCLPYAIELRAVHLHVQVGFRLSPTQLALGGHSPMRVPVDHGVDRERVPYHLKEVPDHWCGQC